MGGPVTGSGMDIGARLKRVHGGLLPGVGRIPGLEAARLRALSAAISSLEVEQGKIEKQLAELKEEARIRGFDEGRSEAMEQAVTLIAGAGRARAGILEGVRGEIAGLALKIAEKVVAQRIENTPPVVAAILEEFTSVAGGGPCVKAFLNPADIEALTGTWKNAGGFSIIPDPSLPIGGCRVETGNLVFECGTIARLERIADELHAGGR